MKIQLGTDLGSYSFNHTTKIVTLSIAQKIIALEQILAIIHVPTGQVLYGVGMAALVAANFSSAVGSSQLTLNASVPTTGLADADPLMILINNDYNNVTPIGESLSYQPSYEPTVPGKQGLAFDPSNNLLVRSQVLTDEGGYRANFSGTSLAVAIGTCVFTNGDTQVTGTGFDAYDLHIGDYVYLTADGSGYAIQVEDLTLTEITLVSPYLGAGGTGAASRQILMESIGAGASFSVSGSNLMLNAGTTASVVSNLDRAVDYLPMAKQCGLTISGRILNQDIYCGLYDDVATPKWYYWFHFTGVDPTKVICECAFNATGAPTGKEIRQQTVTCPNTGVFNRYRVEALRDRVMFYINDVLVATEYAVLPRPTDLLTSTIKVINGTTPATNTLITVDFDACQNYNAVTTDQSSQGPIQVGGKIVVDDGAVLIEILKKLDAIANPVSTDTNSRVRVVLDAITGALTLATITTVGTVTTVTGVTTVSTVTSLSQIGAVPANSFIHDTMLAAWAHAIRPRIT